MAPARPRPRDLESGRASERTPLLHALGPAAIEVPVVNDVNTAAADAQLVQRSPRLLYLDHVRGLLMVLQSIDHSRYFLSRISLPHEEWWNMPDYQGSYYHLLVRGLSAICAPGFMLTMGMSIVLFSNSRMRLNWPWSKILNHFFLRGAVLVVVNWAMQPAFASLVTTVLFALGINIFLGALILALEHTSTTYLTTLLLKRSLPSDTASTRATTASITLYALAATLITCLASWYTPAKSHADDSFNPFFRLFFLPSKAADGLYSMYPPVPWLGMVLWGIGLQRLISTYNFSARTTGLVHAVLGTLMWVIFIPLRLNEGFGNINPGELHPSPRESVISFFNLTKYPPSVVYTCCTMGIVHWVCAGFVSAEGRWGTGWWGGEGNVLVVFGRSAFFFYILHFYVYRTFQWLLILFHFITPGTGWGDQAGNLPDPWYWLSWMAGLVVLYFACERYGRFKAGTPADSLWRFF
ncbi:uncharacterized protein EV422DRAFT_70197 [Fimicolochytrium jonesii]|uniref:uncharacterized protein n=1 Tax=Fimicolochytrium jonesii TaxID=1396493 RepID=UPI0022FEBFCF|nr:uncharacterized protein EV422DRAFT_70197 [Fimicolochytrium jonesii]KAI8820436.1 hypothetical protein EV422DRAFT_70197 [Fimicolochytrium jonesii]